MRNFKQGESCLKLWQLTNFKTCTKKTDLVFKHLPLSLAGQQVFSKFNTFSFYVYTASWAKSPCVTTRRQIMAIVFVKMGFVKSDTSNLSSRHDGLGNKVELSQQVLISFSVVQANKPMNYVTGSENWSLM